MKVVFTRYYPEWSKPIDVVGTITKLTIWFSASLPFYYHAKLHWFSLTTRNYYTPKKLDSSEKANSACPYIH